MARSQPPAGLDYGYGDETTPMIDRFVGALSAKLMGNDVAPEDKQAADLKEKCRAANPFPLIAWLLPELVVTDPAESPFFEGEIGNPDNPCLRMDHWQRRIIASAFDDTISEIAIKGNTKAGKGMSVALSVMLWFYVFDQCKIIVTSQRYEHAVDVMLGEIAMWISRVVHPFPGKVLAQGISANKQRYLTVANPQSGEGFSGQHGPRTLFIFDEACHDDETEVLTDSGWKFFRDLDGSESLLTMHPQTHVAEYQKPKCIYRAGYMGPMYRYCVRGADFCVTPDHKMLYQHATSDGGGINRHYSEWKIDRIRDIADNAKANCFLSRRVNWSAPEQSEFVLPELTGGGKNGKKSWPERRFSMDDWMEFLGWYFSEGSLQFVKNVPYSVQIAQKGELEFRRIQQLLEKMGLEPKGRFRSCGCPQLFVYSRQLAEHLLQFGRGCKVKRIPQYVRMASPRQIDIFLRACIRGDGYDKGKNESIIYTSNRGLAGDLQELALKAGFLSRVTVRPLAGKVADFGTHKGTSSCDGYTVAIRNTPGDRRINMRSRYLKVEDYYGMIHCAEVPPHHLMLTRRNGCVLWSGNTSIPDSFYDDAQKQARKIIAPANPRPLAGWFRNMYKPCDDPNRTQIVNGPFGRRLCVTVDGADNMNVRHRRLEKPLGPPGGIEISGRRFEHNDTIPPEFHAQVKLLIPNQCDYGRFMGICQHPDPRHVDVFAHGKFPTEDPEKQVILGSWLEFHQLAWDAAGRGEALPVECFGLDTALSTDGDATVLAVGGSKGCRATHKWNFADNTKHVEEVLRITRDVYGVDLKLRQHPVCVDYGGGYGAGVGDILAAMGVWVIPFRPGTPSVVDKSRYGNLRAEGWGTLGRRLDPNDQWGGQAWALPRDSELEAELTAPEKVYGGEGFRFLITPKTSEKAGVISLKERLGRSPDTADAVVCLFHAVRELFSLNQWFMANSGPLTVYPQPEPPPPGSPASAPVETDLLKFLEDRYGSGGRLNADDDDPDNGWTLNRGRGVW